MRRFSFKGYSVSGGSDRTGSGVILPLYVAWQEELSDFEVSLEGASQGPMTHLMAPPLVEALESASQTPLHAKIDLNLRGLKIRNESFS